MLFLNARKAFLAAMFVLGAVALLIAYSGTSAPYIFNSPAEKAAAPTVPESQASAGGQQEIAGGETKNNPSPSQKENENFFVDYRLDREKSRGRQVEILEAIVNNPSTATETRKSAQEQLIQISGNISKEVRVENLLRAKGYQDAVVCLDQRGATVVMESQGLTPSEEAGLIDMVSKETGFGEQGIVIIPKKK